MPAAPSLLETERRFLAALYGDDGASPLDAIDAIAGNGLEPNARLNVYRHSSREIQTAALRTTYPAVLALVGAAFFDQTAQSYRRAHPSRSGNLQAFGAGFADHLESLPATRGLAYLPDVARLEWLRQQAALAGDADPLSTDDLATAVAAAGAAARTTLHPSVRLLASAHAALTVWRYAMQPTADPLQLPASGERVLLWREDDQVAMAALDPASFACIEALAQGSTLGAAADAAVLQDAQFDLAACVESLVVRGLLVRAVSVASGEPLPCRSSIG